MVYLFPAIDPAQGRISPGFGKALFRFRQRLGEMGEDGFQFISRRRRLIIGRHLAEIEHIENLLPVKGGVAVGNL